MTEKMVRFLIFTGGCMIIMAFAVDWIGLSKPGFGLGQFTLAMLGYYAILTGICIKLFRGYFTKEYLLKELASLIRKNRVDILLTFILFSLGVAIATSYVASIQANGSNHLFYPQTAVVELPHQLIWMQPFFPHGILFGLTSALAYGIFRVGGIGRVLSVIGCVGFMTSSMHLYNLVPSPLRDYAKVPFILAIILITIMMVALPMKRLGIISLTLVSGFVLGIGLLVRQDLLIFILLPIISIVLFLPSPLCKDIKLKGIVFMILIITLIPQLLILKAGEKGPARIIGGLMSTMDERLGISRPAYDYGYLVLDEFIWTYPYAQAMLHEPGKTFSFVDSESGEKKEIQINFIRKIIVNFPADMLARGYAALLRVLELPFTYLLYPFGIKNTAIMAVYSVRAAILAILSGTSIFLVVIALLIISAHGLRLAFFVLFLILFLGCYPVLQFFGRHYFHLEFIAWWAIGFVIQHAVLMVVWFAHRLRSFKLNENIAQFRMIDLQSIKLRRILIFGLSSIIIILTPLLGLRYYQKIHLNELLHTYKQVDLEPLPFTKEVLPNGNILFFVSVNDVNYLSNNVAVDYLVADFNNKQCQQNTIWPILRYQRDPNRPSLDFSRLINIDINQSSMSGAHLIFPALAITLEDDTIRNKIYSTRFAGIEMSPLEASCMGRFYRIKEASNLPLLLTGIPGKPAPLYQRLNEEISNIYTVPSHLENNHLKRLLKADISPLRLSNVDFKSDIVNITENKWDIEGYAANPCAANARYMPNLCQTEKRLAKTAFAVDYASSVKTDLVWTKKLKQTKGNYFMVQGKLYAGGVTFGLVKDDRTAGAVTVTKRGPFTVVIEVPEDGLYSVGMANALDWFTSLENRFVIHRMGWVEHKHVGNIKS